MLDLASYDTPVMLLDHIYLSLGTKSGLCQRSSGIFCKENFLSRSHGLIFYELKYDLMT